MKVVQLVSGGMDSVTMLYHYHNAGAEIHGLSFFYGQRHQKELERSAEICKEIGVQHDVIDVSTLGTLMSKGASSLVNPDIAVPDGHYAEQTMKKTIVPNRNAMMLSMAFSVAIADEADIVAFAAHGGDHFIYPDCRPAFADAFRHMEVLANDSHSPTLETPFIHWTKADIAYYGHKIGVPLVKTWSCYKGGEIHCGTCGTCVERQEAFSIAGVSDPTEYADPEFWKKAVKEHVA